VPGLETLVHPKFLSGNNWSVLGTFHNNMVFHDLHNVHVDFEPWLGRPKKTCSLCLVRDLRKKAEKRSHENPLGVK
jgi:hypothetical protein